MSLRLKKKVNFKASPGYHVTSEPLYRLWNLALLAIIGSAALPVIGAIYLLLRLTQRSPIFYKGIRLGRNRKPFIIYKFRTLATYAERRTQSCVLPPQSGLETKIGKFLRVSRLDELPQLYNVLRGDMNFFGPRPVRRVIARQAQRKIARYDFRFAVKPGLVGYAQLFMTHRTPKALRARLNAHFCKRNTCFWKEPFIMALTVWGMARKSVEMMLKLAHRRIKAFMRRRRKESVAHEHVDIDRLVNNLAMRKTSLAYFCTDKDKGHINCVMLSINHEAFALLAPVPLSAGNGMFLLQRDIKRAGKKIITAKCKVDLVLTDKSAMEPRFFYRYSAYYKPLNDFDAYVIDKFFLGNSILV
jgi:lipopolysaccharide/colanic/teichoic acid biosynthesis glycosyltransferase